VDTDIKKIMDRFKKDNYVIINDGYLTKQIVKKPFVKQMRKNNELIIARDRAKKQTLLFKIPKI